MKIWTMLATLAFSSSALAYNCYPTNIAAPFPTWNCDCTKADYFVPGTSKGLAFAEKCDPTSAKERVKYKWTFCRHGGGNKNTQVWSLIAPTPLQIQISESTYSCFVRRCQGETNACPGLTW